MTPCDLCANPLSAITILHLSTASTHSVAHIMTIMHLEASWQQ
jgi:hypothetical protein